MAEGIVNAIAHRDYASNGSVQVMLFEDRLEIWNPGRLPASLTIEQLRGPHGSIPTNPLLAEPMYLTGYIERLGTGTRDMIRLCKKAGLPEPEFAQEGNFKLIFRRKTSAHRKSTEQVPDKYRTSTGQGSLKEKATREIEKLILVIEGEMSNSNIMDALNLRHRQNFRDNYLLPALDKGFIEMTIPEKPQSSKQKYRLTDQGKELKTQLLAGET